jgi:3-oxoacyl-(acyl-carrier-protein) synthase
LALKDAALAGRYPPERIGLHVAMARGPVGAAQVFSEELARVGVEALGAKFFPPIVLSILGGQIGLACQIRGASFTFIDGAGAGLQALAHAHDFLRQHDELDAILVVACDEVGQAVHTMADTLGALAPGGEVSLYHPAGAGFVPGEGSVALLVERASAASARGGRIYGHIAGVAYGSEARADEAVDDSGAVLADVAARALAQSGGAAPDLVYGLARGAGRHDRREAAALHTVLNGQSVPVSTLNAQLGLADATSGLYAATAALLGLRHGEVYSTCAPVGGDADGLDVVQGGVREAAFARALVLASSEHGNSAAVVFSSEG